MNGAVGLEPMARDQKERIAEVVTREQSRLHRFIRRRVPNPRDAEDVLQDVFATLAEANSLLLPLYHVARWLFRVARNRMQALGLLVLARILFGGRGGHWFGPSRHRFTREERERFREKMRARFCDDHSLREDGEPPAGTQT